MSGGFEIAVGATLLPLLGGFLVFLTIPAIGMLEAGLIRRRNLVNGLMKGLVAAAVFLPTRFLMFPLYFSPVISGGYPGGFYPVSGSSGVPVLVYAFFMGFSARSPWPLFLLALLKGLGSAGGCSKPSSSQPSSGL